MADPEKKLHRKLCGSLEDAIKRSGLQDGMTISFHHAFREGDKVINQVVDTLARMGFRNLTLASPVHLEISANEFANPTSKSAYVDRVDAVILSALEVDLDFNVNVIDVVRQVKN